MSVILSKLHEHLPEPLASSSHIVLYTGVAVLLGLVLVVSSSKEKVKLPGPRPWPIVGNLPQIGEVSRPVKFRKHSSGSNLVLKLTDRPQTLTLLCTRMPP